MLGYAPPNFVNILENVMLIPFIVYFKIENGYLLEHQATV